MASTRTRWSAALLAAAAVIAPAGCGGQHHRAKTVSATKGSGSVTEISTAPASSSAPATGPTGEDTSSPSSVSLVARTDVSVAGHTMTVPAGWRAELWAKVPAARLEVWTPARTLLVSEPTEGRIVQLTPRRGQPAEPPVAAVLISGLLEPQGMAFDRVGGQVVLYVAEHDEIDRYAWLGDRIGSRQVIVANLPYTAPAGSDNHRLKEVVVGPGHRFYVDIGSGSNAGPVQVTNPPRASVVSYAASGADMTVVATGVRNGDGLSFAPDGSLWSAVNERDQISYPFHRAYAGHAHAYGRVIQAYVNEHPPDEIARLTQGRNLGWPYCDPEPDAAPGVEGTKLTYLNLPFTDDQQANPTGSRLNCASLPPLQLGLPAHSAPLGFHFLEGSSLPAPWSSGAVVAVHGSFDRNPPRAPAVLWLPWDSRTHTLGQALTLIGGFQEPNDNRWGRPVDVVPGPDGALYVSDDTGGAIYRIVP